MARKYTLHPEVLTRSYKGAVVRFRKVEDDVYMPVKDVRDLLMTGGCSYPIFQICGSSCKIEFYTTGNGITAILPWDIENLAKGGMRRNLSANQQERIAWLKATCKTIKDEESKPENALKIFDSQEFGQVRVQVKDGEPMFCLSDVCKALSLTPSKVAQRIEKGVLSKYTLETPGGVQSLNFISEDGLYDVVLESRKPEARAFRKWVVKEVLPSIRRTGGYVVATPEDTPEIVMARGIMAAKEALDKMTQRALSAESSLEIATPKVEYYDAVITDRAYFTTTEIASELGTSYATLKKKLYQAGIVSTLTGNLTVNPQYKDYGEIQVRNGIRTRNDFKWNRAGRDAIFELINPEMPK